MFIKAVVKPKASIRCWAEFISQNLAAILLNLGLPWRLHTCYRGCNCMLNTDSHLKNDDCKIAKVLKIVFSSILHALNLKVYFSYKYIRKRLIVKVSIFSGLVCKAEKCCKRCYYGSYRGNKAWQYLLSRPCLGAHIYLSIHPPIYHPSIHLYIYYLSICH